VPLGAGATPAGALGEADDAVVGAAPDTVPLAGVGNGVDSVTFSIGADVVLSSPAGTEGDIVVLPVPADTDGGAVSALSGVGETVGDKVSLDVSFVMGGSVPSTGGSVVVSFPVGDPPVHVPRVTVVFSISVQYGRNRKGPTKPD
jgi:hypothetical protein